MSTTGKPILPKSLYYTLRNALHHQGHFGTLALVDSIKKHWIAKGIRTCAMRVCQQCHICMAFNQRQTKVKSLGKKQLAHTPFECLQIDYIHMPKCKGFKYALVIFELLTKWPEEYQARHNNAAFVVKSLLREIITRFSVPAIITSDSGSHFANHVLNDIYQTLAIK